MFKNETQIFGLLASLLMFFAAAPASTSYKLESYGVGSGGASSSSTTYRATTITGEQGHQLAQQVLHTQAVAD